VEDDCLKKLANDADSLQRAKEDCNKQELHLKREIQKREADQARCDREELKRTAAYEQKMGALRLMERRARDEAATKVQKKQNEVDSLGEKIKQLETDLREARDRTRDAEKAHDAYIARSKKFPETVLREENATLKAQLEVIRAEVERERRHVTEESMKTLRCEQRIAELLRKISYLEAQMADTARMEMDQLRLQFMAREERCVVLCVVFSNCFSKSSFSDIFWTATVTNCVTSRTRCRPSRRSS
jgi:chromosome segregation ATPase